MITSSTCTYLVDANPSDGNAYPLGVVAPPQHTGGASAQPPPGISRVGSGQDLYGHRTDVPPKYATLPGKCSVA